LTRDDANENTRAIEAKQRGRHDGSFSEGETLMRVVPGPAVAAAIIGWIVAIPALVVLVRVGVEGFLLPFDRAQHR